MSASTYFALNLLEIIGALLCLVTLWMSASTYFTLNLLEIIGTLSSSTRFPFIAKTGFIDCHGIDSFRSSSAYTSNV